eukprot:5357865-Amphidinium_carterae.1
MHIIDMTTRFAAARIAPSKSEEDLCQTISEAWITHHGPPRAIIFDEETGLHGKVTADFAERHGADLVFKAPHQHAGVIERHNAMLRRQLHAVEGQMVQEGRTVDFREALAMSVFAKNATLMI